MNPVISKMPDNSNAKEKLQITTPPTVLCVWNINNFSLLIKCEIFQIKVALGFFQTKYDKIDNENINISS